MVSTPDRPRIDTVLVANRGEIAVRIIRTLRAMSIRSVAVFSEPDRDARHVIEADTAVLIGPAAARESYLDISKVIAAAQKSSAQAIHPGYGFLSENPAFAQTCLSAGIVFIGPPVSAIIAMGDKIAAKTTVSAAGVPVVPGLAEPGLTDSQLISAAAEIGYPVLVKPSAGGGGKGMRRVNDPAQLPDALISARREAAASFGDDTLFIERFLARPRHIEVQVLADGHGNVVHLGERECSLQRRHQKVIEEAPSPLLDNETRERIGVDACRTASSVGYVGAGTVEFIVSADHPDELFFMEMNTRLQVEHPVTEMITGIDLVEWQLRIARGEPLAFTQSDVAYSGHAIEARVYAEDPAAGFLPTGGSVVTLSEPVGSGIRVDSGLQLGTLVGSDYDPMLSKVIAHGTDRLAALRGLDRALGATVIAGVGTNIDFVRFLLSDPQVIAGNLDTDLLDRCAASYSATPATDLVLAAAAAHCWITLAPSAGADPWDTRTGWRLAGRAPLRFLFRDNNDVHEVSLLGEPRNAKLSIDGRDPVPFAADSDGTNVTVALAGQRDQLSVVADLAGRVWVTSAAGTWVVDQYVPSSLASGDDASGDAELRSPMPGTVIAVSVQTGERVEPGDAVVVVEAMKMEHAVKASIAGTVELAVAVGDQVAVNQSLARILPVDGAEAQTS